MATAEAVPLEVLYERDETAWLEAMSALAAAGRLAEMDNSNLSEYLADMAKRDRREVFSRLVVLLAHLLKGEHSQATDRGRGVEQSASNGASYGSCLRAAPSGITRSWSCRTPTPKPAGRLRTSRNWT